MPDPQQRTRAKTLEAVLLLAVAGFVDAYALHTFHVYASFASGNTTTSAVLTGEGRLHDVLPPAVAILGFILGSFTGSMIQSSRLRRRSQTLFLVSAALLSLYTAFAVLHVAGMFFPLALLSFAMAMLNPSVKTIGHEPVNITFISGALNKMAGHFALAIRGRKPAEPTSPHDTHLRRGLLEASLWLSLIIGALLCLPALHLGPYALLPAIATLFLLTFTTANRA